MARCIYYSYQAMPFDGILTLTSDVREAFDETTAFFCCFEFIHDRMFPAQDGQYVGFKHYYKKSDESL